MYWFVARTCTKPILKNENWHACCLRRHCFGVSSVSSKFQTGFWGLFHLFHSQDFVSEGNYFTLVLLVATSTTGNVLP